MLEVKAFIESFCRIEAEIESLKRKPDLVAYNEAVEKYNSLVTDRLRSYTLKELRDEEYYEMFAGKPSKNARHLYKISQYSHGNYGEVWVAYVSQASPRENMKYLTDALFVIKKEGVFKVAKFFIYSRYGSDGAFYQWEKVYGEDDLAFESVEGPIAIERYQEPLEDFEGLKHYHALM